MNLLEGIGIVAGVITGTASLAYTIHTRREDNKRKELEKLELKEKEALPIICFYEYELQLGETYNIVIGVPHGDYQKSLKLVSSFPFAIANLGGTDLEDISVIYKYAIESSLTIPDEFLKLKKSLITTNDRTTHKDSDNVFIEYRIKNIHPKMIYRVSETMRITPTHVTTKAVEQIIGGKKYLVKFDGDYIHMFEVIVTIKNFYPRSIKFNLEVIESSNLEDLESLLVKKELSLKKKNLKVQEIEKKRSDYIIYYPDIENISKTFKSKLLQASFNEDKIKVITINDGRVISKSMIRNKENRIEL